MKYNESVLTIETCRVDEVNRCSKREREPGSDSRSLRKNYCSTNLRMLVRGLVKEDEVFGSVEFLRAQE